MNKLLVAVTLAALLMVSLGPPASAQPAPAPTALPATAFDRSKGLMFRLGLGITGCTDDWCDNVDPSANLRVVALYRFHKYAAAGLHLGFLFGDPESDYGWGGGSADHVWNLFIGAEGRGIYPYKNFELWAGLSLGYSRMMVDGSVDFMGVNYSYRGWANSIALGFGFGADYYITRNIAVGVNFYLYKPWATTVCTKAEDTDTECDDVSDSDQDNIGIIWAINAMATFFLPL